MELFSSIQVGSKMAHNHTFACPVFALQNKLAAGNSIPKWSPRARLGLNLGPSPMHARNVYLVLNLSTGLVSPQYHCCFNDFFETTKYGRPDVAISSTWQQLAGLGCAIDIPSQSQTSRPMPGRSSGTSRGFSRTARCDLGSTQQCHRGYRTHNSTK